MTRVSRRKSDAFAHADPMAIPTSIELIVHGTVSGFSMQVGNPQYAQFNPCFCFRLESLLQLVKYFQHHEAGISSLFLLTLLLDVQRFV